MNRYLNNIWIQFFPLIYTLCGSQWAVSLYPTRKIFENYQIFLNNIELEGILSMDYNNSEEVFLISISIFDKLCIIPYKFEVNFGPKSYFWLKKLAIFQNTMLTQLYGYVNWLLCGTTTVYHTVGLVLQFNILPQNYSVCLTVPHVSLCPTFPYIIYRYSKYTER